MVWCVVAYGVCVACVVEADELRLLVKILFGGGCFDMFFEGVLYSSLSCPVR